MRQELAVFLVVFLATSVTLATPRSEPVPHTPSIDFSEGRDGILINRSFWRISGVGGGVPFRTDAELISTSSTAYWYIEAGLIQQGLNYTPAAMNAIMSVFENTIIPRLHSAFGYEPLPPNDIDGDPMGTILITTDISYFDTRNEKPATIEPISNEREMIYVRYQTDSNAFLSIVAHEFTHLIVWNYDPSEVGWIGEGLASVAQRVVGYDSGAPPYYLENTSVGLWSGRYHWLASYGAWELFVQYLADRFGGWTLTRALTQNPRQGVVGVEDTLSSLGYATDFRSIFRDWMITNLVNNATTEGRRFQYTNMTERAAVTYSADRYPWSASIPIENGGMSYIRLPVGQSESGLRVELPNASANGVVAVLVIQHAESVHLEPAKAQGQDLVLETGWVAPLANVTLAVAYLNESGFSVVSVSVRVANVPNEEANFVLYVVLGLAMAVVVALLMILRRRRTRTDADR